LEYLSLYRKWRPKSFSDGFIGQEHVVRTLKNALTQNKIAHAYLFSGPRGTGKTTVAKILAKAVNCRARGDNPDPCNACPSCQRINDGVSMDVLEIDGASNRGIDEIRVLRERVKFAPVEGDYKVYIIDEAHMLTAEAFNALLKTLEEPPAHVIFIFATTESHKFPATILSRCQRFDFKRLSSEEIYRQLAFIAGEEELKVEEGALRLIAGQAGGGMRDAIGILEQAAAHAQGKLSAVDVRAVLGLVEVEALFSLGEAVAGRDLAAAFRLVQAVEEAGKDPALFARQAAEFFRDLLVLQLPGEQAPVGLEPEATGRARELAGQIEAALLKKGVECFLEAGVAIRRGTEGALSLEMALVRLILEEPGVEGVSERLAALEERLVRLEKAVQAYPGARTVSRRIESDGKGVPEARSSSTQAPAARTPETRAAKTRTGKAHTQEAAVPLPGEAGAAEKDNTLTGPSVDFPWWDRLLEEMRGKKRTVEALLKEGIPRSYRPGHLVVAFAPGYRFHWENVKRPDNLRLVEEVLSRLAGERITVECVLEEEEARTSGKEPELVQKALSLFGGEVVKAEEEE
jgi:DNA polymerase-3 subunit gamma/tau